MVSKLSIAICSIQLFIPLCVLCSPLSTYFKEEKNQDKSYACITFLSLTYLLSFFFCNKSVAAKSIFKKNRLCPSPNWLEKRSCLTPVPVRRKSIITNSFPFFSPHHAFWLPPFTSFRASSNLRNSKASWGCSCWPVLPLKQWGVSSKAGAFLKAEV